MVRCTRGTWSHAASCQCLNPCLPQRVTDAQPRAKHQDRQMHLARSGAGERGVPGAMEMSSPGSASLIRPADLCRNSKIGEAVVQAAVMRLD